MNRHILVTAALPYGNGAIHLGHLVGYIQADIWVRFQKMRGNTCFYVCGDDSHGTPIMIQAQKKKIDPEIMIAQIKEEHEKDFKDFYVDFDHFHTTHSPENKKLSEAMYNAHLKQGNIVKRIIKQAYDPEKKMFLPDRFIKGECPRCHANDQYGDNCETCGATYAPTELINPYSTLSGEKPIEKESEHYFFKLENYTHILKSWIQSGALQEEVANKLSEWFEAGLKEWDISRDAPYFGFTIPGETNKYFYCWLDAPIAYMASFQYLCEHGANCTFDAYWNKNSNYELYHFIGKDIIYFHALFWPALLAGAGFRMPTAIWANGFLTINGHKMSKSRGTFINARDYLTHLNPEYLRYYYATKFSAHIEDLDMNLENFKNRINSDLVGKFINIASRCAGFIEKYFSGKLSKTLENKALYDIFSNASEEIAEKYEAREYAQAIRLIMALTDRANQYIDEKKPWTRIKEEDAHAEVHAVCSLGLNLFRCLMIYLKPVLPKTAKAVEDFLQVDILQWADVKTPLLNHAIKPFAPLMQRIDPSAIEPLKNR